jgi:parallel beta-helix repeat protein
MGKGFVFLFVLFFLMASCLTVPLPVNAGSRTLVVPDDYSTISSAIGNATDGDTILVKKGTYEEKTLEISKPLSLVGEDANQTTINLYPPYNETWILTQSFRTYANAITINANDVKLEGFTITSDGGEISVTGNRTQITDNTISTDLSVSGSFNILVENSVFLNINLDNVNSSTITNNTCFSIRIGFSKVCSDNVISGNRIEGGYYGIHIERSTNNVFCKNYFANLHGWGEGDKNAGGGVWFDYGCKAENNTFYHNVFIDNNYNVAFDENVMLIGNLWDNGSEGNYWDDYNGTDVNRDGIGDTPYIINGDNVDYYPLMYPYDIEGDAVVLPPPEPFPTTLVIAAVATATAIVSVGLLILFKKRPSSKSRASAF